MKHILYCEKCKDYALTDPCPRCGERAFERKPPKYSPEDKYGKYRRQFKEEAKQADSKNK